MKATQSGSVTTCRMIRVRRRASLAEFLKEHAKVEQLKKDFESKIAEQRKQIAALTAGLQKMSAQLELSKPRTQTVQNGQ